MKTIAITLGDPAGIGPEVVVKSIMQISEFCRPVLIGDRIVLQEAVRLFDPFLRIVEISTPDEAVAEPGTVALINTGMLRSFEKGKPTAEGGSACAAYIRSAVDLAVRKKVDAVVTAPISKEALKMAGLKWPGHTEMLAELTGVAEYAMMLTGGPLRVVLVTIHTALRNVPDSVTKERVLKTIRLASKASGMLGLADPKIAVAGLNPHAGEAGMFGSEEEREIGPAVDAARDEGIPAFGPFPPDTVFNMAYHGKFDLVVCMYHDQGLIPLKMIAFEEGVNSTIGLPIIRTSPDHGTAYDIAWQGKANSSSMIAAVKLSGALRLL